MINLSYFASICFRAVASTIFPYMEVPGIHVLVNHIKEAIIDQRTSRGPTQLK